MKGASDVKSSPHVPVDQCADARQVQTEAEGVLKMCCWVLMRCDQSRYIYVVNLVL